MGSWDWARIGPASILGASRMTELPVMVSPRMMAQLIGAAPRYFGRREAWRLTLPRRGWLAQCGAIFCPKAMTTMTSAWGSSSALMFWVRTSGRPLSEAN